MEYEPAEYQRLEIKQFAPRALRETVEGRYWRRFKVPVVAKQFGPVSHIDFSQQSPYNFAVTAATRVILYDGDRREVNRTISRFKDCAFSGVYRSDGKLLVAGSQDGMVQVFDTGSRSVLRQFKAHQRPTHVTRFSPDKQHVLSGSDDVTVRWWDITSGSQVMRLDGHTDYVRAASVSPVNMETWVTGGYDHEVKVWDVRSKACSLTLDHGAPVEDLAFFTSGSLLVSAGGNQLCVWDLVSGGRRLKRLTNFQKTVTCVRMSPLAGPDSLAAPRMLAGSLDGHVKIFELDSFKVTHASKYPAPVMSLGISPDCKLLAVGMADGTLSIRQHDRPRVTLPDGTLGPASSSTGKLGTRVRLDASNFRYFIRGQNVKASMHEYRVVARRKAKLKPYDKLLRQFKYRDALNAALQTRKAEIVVTVVEELAARDGLDTALSGRDAASLEPLLHFLSKYIVEPRYGKTVCNLTHRILDIYTGVIGVSSLVDKRLQALKDRAWEELKAQAMLMEIQGILEPVMAASLSALSL
ncbi:hypothetical protein CEUSTIGMA_g7259.t1 [Chlamydomonas eustigma]|uniref:U3 small nucleolar RNA-associated protein 15 C-terminal domain-containing protein n=1 Tax=Chlamydomonas eustigma TaxID=1157962 RepID=A0A250XA97_9CHLO|nr:hypothetical protein CEUSTIGMA_g7259.t1 [Chlamydomonas eustigma]|eukprot:GAX79819.1 hypothetical protein CEUSTIGMA_g7259.t1 [Chlamydomonas eustigma]